MRVNPQNGSDYAPIEQNGAVVKTADEVRQEDFATLWKGIASGQDRVTRLRADLSRGALSTDLQVSASQDQSVIDNIRIPTREKSQPTCPIYEGCKQVGQVPRDEARARAGEGGSSGGGGGGDTFSCAVKKETSSASTSTGLAALCSLAAFFGVVVVRARRARNGGR